MLVRRQKVLSSSEACDDLLANGLATTHRPDDLQMLVVPLAVATAFGSDEHALRITALFMNQASSTTLSCTL